MADPSAQDYVRAAYRIVWPAGFVGDLDYADKLDFGKPTWPQVAALAVELYSRGATAEELDALIASRVDAAARERAARVAAIVAGVKASAARRSPKPSGGISAAERAANTARLLARMAGSNGST